MSNFLKPFLNEIYSEISSRIFFVLLIPTSTNIPPKTATIARNSYAPKSPLERNKEVVNGTENMGARCPNPSVNATPLLLARVGKFSAE